MNLDILKNKKYLFLLIVLFVVLLVSAYFQALYPNMQSYKQAQSSLEQSQKQLTIIQQKITDQSSTSKENTALLQKVIPVKSLTDQFILDIEKAETVSESTVTSLVFQNKEDDKTNSEGILQEKANESTSLETTEEKDATNNTNTEDTTKEVTLSLPTGMKELTANVEIEAKDYFSLEKFISTIENNQRVVVIKSINFEGPKEKTDAAQTNEKLSFQLTVSIFYMPTLTDLQNKVPTLEVPNPSEKVNPLVQ